MADPDNFDDELFADLYNDDEPQAPKAPSAPISQPSIPTKEPAPPVLEPASHDDQGGEYDDSMRYDDEDDEVDFHLGNGSSSNNKAGDPTTGTSFIPIGNHQIEETPQASSGGNDFQLPAQSELHNKVGSNSKEDGKMFIGGLNWETTDQSLRDYFSQYGEVLECTVMRDGISGRSRGFGFLTFKDPKTVNVVMVKEHYLDGKIIDPKRAIPRDEQEKTSKIFVGGVSQDTTDQDFREYFAQFGRVVDATLMMDKDTGRPRGFGFVTFESEAGVDACLSADLQIHGKPIEVKKAQPRGNLREDDDSNRRGGPVNKFRKGPMGSGGGGGYDDQGGNQQMSGNNGNMAGGMTPQVMAQYWQRMQQYFAVMQQQVNMNRGMAGAGGMPNMPNMPNMGGMGGMGNMGGGMGNMGNMGIMGNMNGMNPQMMQMMQMQQMQQQMMNRNSYGPGGPSGPNGAAMMGNHFQGGGGSGGGNGPPNNGPGGRGNFNAMEQHMFEQQKYDQAQRSGSAGPVGGGPGSAAGGGSNNGSQSPWGASNGGGDGSYDNSSNGQGSQQHGMGHQVGGGGRGGFHNNNRGGGSIGLSDTQNAPPANAPTGPKNAGRPGANYRGGGRGAAANRGFHPYSRG